MATALDRVGTFKVHPISYGWWNPGGGAEAAAVTFEVLAEWDEENQQWIDWKEYEVEVEGYFWLVKKDGTLNQKQVEALARHMGWDGNFESISDQSWRPTDCQVAVTEDEWKGNIRYRAAWINGLDDVPRQGTSSLGFDDAKALQAKHGASIRALMANARQKAPKPAGKPTAPKPQGVSRSQTQRAQQASDGDAVDGDDDIPFDPTPAV